MKTTVSTVQKMKDNGEKITMLTAYDYSTAKLFDEAGIDTMLVGDSLGMVMLGYDSTIPVTVDDMIHHGAAVVRGAKDALIVVDMPFLSYHTSVYDAVANAGRIMKETGCTAVKLEGGKNVCPQIEAIVNAQIPVCAHIGLTPQSSNMFGGFRVQGKSEEAAKELIEAAKLDGAGELKIWRHVMIPGILPSVSTIVIFDFIANWNAFLWPIIVLQDPEKYPLATALQYLNGSFSYKFGYVAAGTVISIIPVLIVFMIFQKNYIEAVSGAVKG